MEKQKYYYCGSLYYVVKEIEINGNEYSIVENKDDCKLDIFPKSSLQKWEETWRYKEEQKIIEEIEK